MRIWDLHCHLPGPRMTGRTLTEQMEQMLMIAERVGIEKIGLFLRTGKQDGLGSDREIRDALRRFEGRVFGFVWCLLYETQKSIDLVKRWVGDGPMIGMKLGGDSGICNRSEYDPVFRQAIDLEAVIYVHTWIKLGGDPPRPGGGNLPTEPRPEHLVELAARYPDYPFICGHAGGDWELGIPAIRSSSNLLLEVSGGYPTAGLVEAGARELGARRVIFGSDVTGRSFASQLGKVHGAAIPQSDKELIFRENFRRLLEPILRRKGIAA